MLASCSHRLSALPLLAALACGDSAGGTASAGQSSTGGTTDLDPTTSTTDPTTGSTGDLTASGGLSGSSSGGPTTDTGPTGTSSTTDTTLASTGSTSTTSTSSTTDTTGLDTTGGADEFPTDCTQPAGDLVLCGADGPACVLKRDELVSDKSMFRNDMPAIALRNDCTPAVLYSEAVGFFAGFYAERTGDATWTAETMPSPVATGSLEVDRDTDHAVALVDDGAFGVTLWTRDGAWNKTGSLAGMNHTRAPQLLLAPGGEVHVGHVDADNKIFHDTFKGIWSSDQVDLDGEIHVRLALGPDAAPHLTYWFTGEGTWQYRYVAPPDGPELVTPLGSNVLDKHHSALALVGADATPWVLISRKQADQIHHDIVLLHRLGAKDWAEETLVGDKPGEDKLCNGEPDGPGQQCMYDYRFHYPLTLHAAGDQLRATYVQIRRKGTSISQCNPNPFPICVWVEQSDESTSELRVAWPGSQLADHQVVATDVFTDRATGRLDAAGNMHLAFYQYPPAGGDPKVRYLAIGP